MTEGKELLLNIIDKKLLSIHSLNKEDIIVGDINLVDLLASIQEDIYNFSNITDEIIEKVVPSCKIKDTESFKKSIKQIRDLLVGRRDYNLKVNLNPEYLKQIKTFVTGLEKELNTTVPGIINVEKVEESCIELIKAIKTKEIIADFSFIEEITKDYNEIEFDNNMVVVMRFINEHNLTILKTPKKNAPLFDIQYIRRPKLDSRIKEILDKLEIDYKDLPNYLIGELKKCDYVEVYQTYSLVKKNKAEEYGILHLIKKENILAKLILLLYATPESVKNIVDSTKNIKGEVDVNLLKSIINTTITCFLVKNNDYFKPKYEDYIKNIMLLKDLGVNYKALILRNPLFMIMSNEVLTYTLSVLERNGADKKLIINKCYKVLSITPELLIDNMNILINHNVDIKSFFASSTSNYNLLKVIDLEKKLNYIVKKYNFKDSLDTEVVNKLIVGKIYREIIDGNIVWSEEK